MCVPVPLYSIPGFLCHKECFALAVSERRGGDVLLQQSRLLWEGARSEAGTTVLPALCRWEVPPYGSSVSKQKGRTG